MYVNNIYIYEGGMYEDGFKCVLICVLNSYGM